MINVKTVWMYRAVCRHYLMIVASAATCSHHVEWLELFNYVLFTLKWWCLRVNVDCGVA